MFDNFLKSVGLDISATVIEALGAAIEVVGELTESATIQSIGQTIRENANDIAS